MPLTARDWHHRFYIQSQWTKDTRDHLFRRTGVFESQRVLDVGCGTGVLCKELIRSPIRNIFGLDLNPEFIEFASINTQPTDFVIADAHNSPFKSSVFDFCFCHYLLMWVKKPRIVITEMKRLTKSGGLIFILAEPDYGGRIDYPEPLTILNDWQTTSLQKQQADPYMGRKLKALLHQSGLRDIEVGVIGAQWKGDPTHEALKSEWEMIDADIESLSNASDLKQIANDIRKIDLAAWATGERIIYVPTFYAWGRVIKA